MSCLHFRINRTTGVCEACGTAIVVGRIATDPDVIVAAAPFPQPTFAGLVTPAHLAAPILPTTQEDKDEAASYLAELKGQKISHDPQTTPSHQQADRVDQTIQPEPERVVRDADVRAQGVDPAEVEAAPREDRHVLDLQPAEVPTAGSPAADVGDSADLVTAAERDAVAAGVELPHDVVPADGTMYEPGSIAYSNLSDAGKATMDRRYAAGERFTLTEDEDDTPPLDEPLYQALMGTAGTGKTYTVQRQVETRSDCILCATTGIAAVNLGGVTINSLLAYPDTAGLRVNYEVGKLGAFLRKLTASGYYRVIVDEVSMMDGHQLDILMAAFDDYNTWAIENGKRQLGMTLVGDFAQLPPVEAPFVFQRPAWGRFDTNVTMLTEPRRQADPEFVRALQAVRRGDRPAAMAYFADRIVQGEEQQFNGSTILAKNDEVDRYNKLRMLQLTAAEEKFKAVRVGEQLSEWKKQIPDELVLKPGCLVMILANKRFAGDPTDTGMMFANGDLGTYEGKINDSTAGVKLMRNGMTVPVQMILKENGKPTGRIGTKIEVKGSILYMPIRVAYATTCHKSQGLSLDNVQIMFHSRFWATSGMLYVALSRARTPQGLRLVGTKEQFEARINVNPDIRRWL